MRIYRLYVEKKPPFAQEARSLLHELKTQLNCSALESVRILQRYDVAGISVSTWAAARESVFSEPQVDHYAEDLDTHAKGEKAFAVEFLPGQFDQRADSAEQCLRILDPASEPLVAHARVFLLSGELSADDLQRIKAYCINPVDSHETGLGPRQVLRPTLPPPPAVPRIRGFTDWDETSLLSWKNDQGLAMSQADARFVQQYFRDQEARDPTETEIRVLDTYWSDHCRHTTFLTRVTDIDWGTLQDEHPIRRAFSAYLRLREECYGEAAENRPITLMDLATIGMKWHRKTGKLDDLEVSEEVNAASIRIRVRMQDGSEEPWLLMFKNETHNHPTEIEPFGGAATCLGGAIRDPLSGRAYVYQAMRVTGAADPRAPFADTLPGKLPQRVITTEAAAGYSSYGNQIGLATGMVDEVYHPDYLAKRMEIGAVIAAAPEAHVIRAEPSPGDVILLLGGKTGRDGIGGATGSSKEHNESALQNTAEVQKGNPPVERALQRLFRRPEAARQIKRCNDFGAGGVSVAIGELAESLEIDLDAVPLKYEGLSGTDLAISESQERMAVCLDPAEVEAFTALAGEENLLAVPVARVTDTGRLVMRWRGDTIVDIRRSFLDTNGVPQEAAVALKETTAPLIGPLVPGESAEVEVDAWRNHLSTLAHCSRQGLIERFDGTIGAGTVLHPLGGRFQRTPPEAMAALIPNLDQDSTTASLMSWGFDPDLALACPFRSALYAVVHSVTRLVAAGADPSRIRLTFQEYFEKLRGEPVRWAKPFSALLGALTAQIELEAPAVGGKDSMSGSYHERDVPPTLVAFAVSAIEAEHTCSPEFKAPGQRVTLLIPEKDANGLPVWSSLRALLRFAAEQNQCGALHAMAAPGPGGLARSLFLMAAGNGVGFNGADDLPSNLDPFAPATGCLLLVSKKPLPASTEFRSIPIGTTTGDPSMKWREHSMSLESLLTAWQAPLEDVFPTRPESPGPTAPFVSWENNGPALRSRSTCTGPEVLIPTFPGTNCEWDSARAFRLAGGKPRILLFRNPDAAAVAASIDALADAIRQTRILMLPGGFSAGDEPDGSGKFIAAVFRNEKVAAATQHLLEERDGLILGICNGFQALVKLGLLPYGTIRPSEPSSPTLTFNTIDRHVSRYVTTRVASTLSPWLGLCRIGDLHTLPVSHGEGRFFAPQDQLVALRASGQIAAQYVNANGEPAADPLTNPNGSLWNIEAITSADGRILGKMGHSERCGPNVARNIPGAGLQPIFQAGIRYFQGE